ncbi:Tethering factor for nuclear proteasome sts1 [Saitoella coloradoensis]
MDSRSPLAAIQRSSPFDPFNQIQTPLRPVTPFGAASTAGGGMGSSARKSRKRGRDDDSPSPGPGSERDVGDSPTPLSKRQRNIPQGRPLPLPRLLSSLDNTQLQSIILGLTERHPQLLSEVQSLAPRPTITSSISVLHRLEAAVREAFPYGGDPAGDYAYNRVRPFLNDLLSALMDYTPHFLPPHESYFDTSLSFLDEATHIIHRLPNWSNPLHNISKRQAYEEMCGAWICVLRDAITKSSGVGLVSGGWVEKVEEHNEVAGGRLGSVVEYLRGEVGWLRAVEQQQGQQGAQQQVLSGLFGGGYTAPAASVIGTGFGSQAGFGFGFARR